MHAEITVRRIRTEEWERLRAIRLRALADAPMAFGSTLADEQTRLDEFWRGRAAGGAADDDRATCIAERDGVWVGIGTCVLEAEGTGEQPAWIFGMWVDPAIRVPFPHPLSARDGRLRHRAAGAARPSARARGGLLSLRGQQLGGMAL
jgi:hypothetical protein